jgi:hypothetical protein
LSLSVEREPEAPHDGPRGDVFRLVDADDRFEPELVEPVTDPRVPGFGREAATTMPLAKPPPDLNRREDLREERRDGQSRPASKLAGVGDDNCGHRRARFLVALDRALQERLGLCSRPAPTEWVSPE